MLTRSTLIACAIALLLGCGEATQETRTQSVPKPPDPPVVYTVNYPLAYFAERIGGAFVEVHFPAPADVDPAYWSPSGEEIVAYQKADVVLLNGAGYAKWLQRVSLPRSVQADTSAGFSDRLLPLEEAVTHSHGPGGEHEHTGVAFTTWLDPALAVEQARSVAEALAGVRPEDGLLFRDGLTELEADLSAVDARLTAAAAAIGEAPLLFSHPVYQYLTARFGLNGRSLHWEPDEAPKIDELGEVLHHHPAKWMVWEGQPLEATVAALQAQGIESVVFDPCGNRPESGDLLTVMTANAGALEEIAGATSPR